VPPCTATPWSSWCWRAMSVPTRPLQRIIAKPLVVKGQAQLSLVYRHQTRDITRNLPLDQAQALVAELLPESFRNAHLFDADGEVQLSFSKKGKPMLQRHGAQAPREAVANTGHDREKKRYLELSRPFLRDLGVTDAQGALIPSMSRKWKQINKFIEVFDHALANCPGTCRADAAGGRLRFGKGYLTFAMHDYLRNTLAREAQVTGVELRQDMVDLCNAAAQRLEHPGLEFQCGDVRSVVPEAIEVMIALHACDIATDYAIHTGIRCNAAIIMCSPCCHKQIRPQLHSPGLLQPMLQVRAAPGAAGRDAYRQPARAVPGSLRLRDQGVRVHLPGAHQQEQDDSCGEAPAGRG
jgi:hypothetical protein